MCQLQTTNQQWYIRDAPNTDTSNDTTTIFGDINFKLDAWFLKIISVWMSVCVRVHVFIHPLGY